MLRILFITIVLGAIAGVVVGACDQQPDVVAISIVGGVMLSVLCIAFHLQLEDEEAGRR